MEPPSPTSVSAQQLITAVILLLLVVVTAGMYTSSCTYCTSYICIAGQLERLISLPSSGSSFSCSSRRWSYNFDSFFYIKIFIVKLYLYILMKVIFKVNLFIWFLHFQTQLLKSYSWFIFPMFWLKPCPKRLHLPNRREYAFRWWIFETTAVG
jgi:hypothetical protein